MKRLLILAAALFAPLALASQDGPDWAGFGRYAAANAALQKAPSVVFMGDSITDQWDDADPEFFAANGYACRGIGGQVTGQMLCRFRADAIDLHPRAVVILGGTNDIARNDGYAPLERIADHIVSMAELARANGIEPILCTILPAGSYPWRPEIEDVPARIAAVNARLREYAGTRGIEWLDCHTPLAASDGSMRAEYTTDGVHLNAEGYALLERTIAPVLAEYAAQ